MGIMTWSRSSRALRSVDKHSSVAPKYPCIIKYLRTKIFFFFKLLICLLVVFLIKLGLLKTGLVEWAQQFFHTSSFTTPSPPKEAAVKYTLIDQKLCSAGKAALGYFRKKK